MYSTLTRLSPTTFKIDINIIVQPTTTQQPKSSTTQKPKKPNISTTTLFIVTGNISSSLTTTNATTINYPHQILCCPVKEYIQIVDDDQTPIESITTSTYIHQQFGKMLTYSQLDTSIVRECSDYERIQIIPGVVIVMYCPIGSLISDLLVYVEGKKIVVFTSPDRVHLYKEVETIICVVVDIPQLPNTIVSSPSYNIVPISCPLPFQLLRAANIDGENIECDYSSLPLWCQSIIVTTMSSSERIVQKPKSASTTYYLIFVLLEDVEMVCNTVRSKSVSSSSTSISIQVLDLFGTSPLTTSTTTSSLSSNPTIPNKRQKITSSNSSSSNNNNDDDDGEVSGEIWTAAYRNTCDQGTILIDNNELNNNQFISVQNNPLKIGQILTLVGKEFTITM
jgi:hypothetical protein